MGRVISVALQYTDAFTNPSKKTIDSLKKMGREAQNAGKSIQSAGKTISSVGSNLTGKVTMPIIAAGAAAVKASNDFNNAMAKVGTIADTTKVPLKTLSKQIVDLSNNMGTSTGELAEAQYQAISAGIDTANSAKFVGTAVKAAKGGFTDTTTAVDGLTTVLNAYGLSADKATAISDQMLAAQNYGKTSFGEMASSMGKVIPIAASMNVGTEELFASVAVLTKNGIATAESVTGLKAAYSNVLKPTADASKAAKKLGLDFSASHLKSVGWAKFLTEIKEKTGGNVETMGKLFGSTEALNSITVLAGKGSKDFASAMELMGRSTGMTQQAYEKMITPQERMNIAINKIKNSAIKFGQALTPVYEKLAEGISKLGDRFNGLSEEQVLSITKFAGIAAAVGPCIMVFGKIVSSIGNVVRMFGKISMAISRAGSVMALITSPAGIAIAAVAGIAIAGVLLLKNWDKVKVFLNNVGNWFKDAFAKAGVPLEPFIDKFKQLGNQIGTNIGTIGNTIKNIIPIIKEQLGGAIQKVGPIIKEVFVSAIKFAVPVVKTFIDTVKNVIPIVKEGLHNVINAAIPVIKSLSNAVKQIVPVIAKLFTTAIKAVVPLIKSYMNTVKTVIPIVGKAFASAFKIVVPVIQTVLKVLNKIIPIIAKVLVKAVQVLIKVIQILGKVFKVVFDVVGFIVTKSLSIVQKIFSATCTVVKTVTSVLKAVVLTTFKNIASYISVAVDTIKGVIDGMKQIFSGITDFISGVFTGNWSKAWNGVKDIFKGIFDSFASLCKAPINAVIAVINNAIEGINSISIDIPDGIPGIGGKHIGFNIGTIPQLYRGTDNWKGGLVQTQERGGEIMDLPKGTRVYPHDKSVEMARKEGAKSASKSSSNIVININKLADKMEVRSDKDVDEIVEKVGTKLQEIALNMG